MQLPRPCWEVVRCAVAKGRFWGVIIGAAVMRLLYNAINISGIPTQLEFAIIGAVILAGVIADEIIRRMAARRRAGRGD